MTDKLNKGPTKRWSRMFFKDCDYKKDRGLHLQHNQERIMILMKASPNRRLIVTTSGEYDPWRSPIQDSFNFHHDTFRKRVFEELTAEDSKMKVEDRFI